MDASIPWFFWLFPVVLTIHNLEEALWLPKFSKNAGRFHKPVGTFEFSFALVVLTMLAAVITALFYMKGKRSIPGYLYFGFNFGMLVNVFVPHLAAAFVLKKYCPGLLTGVLLLAPTTSWLLKVGYQNGYFGMHRFFIISIPFAILIAVSISILFKAGRAIKKTAVFRQSEHKQP